MNGFPPRRFGLQRIPDLSGHQYSGHQQPSPTRLARVISIGILAGALGACGGGGGGGGGDIVDGRFDGAFLGGISVSGGAWRIDANGLWAAVGGDRLELPLLTVDVDVVQFHVSGGRTITRNLYLTGGLRRLALNYNIKLGDRPDFERKPGVWDPLVGLGWHSAAGEKLEVHATFEVGGFGVGTDVEIGGEFRLDWKPIRHFGLTGGYKLLYFKLADEVLSKTFTVEQTLHGPIVGIGFYF